jgi:hypothetical protein
MNLQFEDYLKDVFAKDYMGTDDDMPEAFDVWISDMDHHDLEKYMYSFKATQPNLKII